MLQPGGQESRFSPCGLETLDSGPETTPRDNNEHFCINARYCKASARVVALEYLAILTISTTDGPRLHRKRPRNMKYNLMDGTFTSACSLQSFCVLSFGLALMAVDAIQTKDHMLE